MAMLFPLSQPESGRFFRDCHRLAADEESRSPFWFFLGAAEAADVFGLMVGTPERSYDLSIFHGTQVSACNMAVLSDPLKIVGKHR